MNDITQRQQEFLNFIIDYKNKNNYSPSLRDISKSMGVSVAAVSQNIKALVKKQYIDYTENISRSIVVKK